MRSRVLLQCTIYYLGTFNEVVRDYVIYSTAPIVTPPIVTPPIVPPPYSAATYSYASYSAAPYINVNTTFPVTDACNSILSA